MLPRPKSPWGPVVFVGGLLGCGGDAGVTDPAIRSSVGCELDAPVEIAAPFLIPAGADCLSLDASAAGFAVAFFDSRFVEASRAAPASAPPDAGDVQVTVRSGTGGTTFRSQLVPEEDPAPFRDLFVRLSPGPAVEPAIAPARGDGDDDHGGDDRGSDRPGVGNETGRAGESVRAECATEARIFCREGPWRAGDTLTVPAPFGRFIHETPRPAEILLVREPFAFAVPRELSDGERQELELLLPHLALVGAARALPFLRRAFVDRPVHTSAGSRQILVDVIYDREPVCVCGVAVGHVVDGVAVGAFSIRIPGGPEFEAHRVGLFAHELAHLWQHAHDVDRSRDPAGAAAVAPFWALEGGADFVAQEILRGLAEEPLDGNRDADAPVADPYLDRLLRSLGTATGRIRDGYGQSAHMLRHFFVLTLPTSVAYDDALAGVLRGSLEGWFASPEGEGLAGRLASLWGGFEPVSAVLEYAIANAVDDRTAEERLQNPAVLDAWRPSTGSRFIPAARIGRGGQATIELPAGSVGYVYVQPGGSPTRLRFEADVEGVRWMVVRFE